MAEFALSPALKGFTLDNKNQNPEISIVGFGEIDLRTISEYQLERITKAGIQLPGLKPNKEVTSKP